MVYHKKKHKAIVDFWNYRLFIDDITFPKDDTAVSGRTTVEEYVQSNLAENATVNAIVVKDENGDTVTLTEGAITESGVYFVSVTTTENGEQKEYSFKINV